jgi:hypothetical protein
MLRGQFRAVRFWGQGDIHRGDQLRVLGPLGFIRCERPSGRRRPPRADWMRKGTPKYIADHKQEWFTNAAAGGFNLLPAVTITTAAT